MQDDLICVRACMRACVRACVRACMRACVTCSNKMSRMSANLISRKHATMFFNSFDLLVPKYILVSFLSIGNAYFSFIL